MRIEETMRLAQLVMEKPRSLGPTRATYGRREITDYVFASSAPPEDYPSHWARQWLASKTFTLAEVELTSLGSPHNDGDENRIMFLMASNTKPQPLVVDVNVNKIGKTKFGYFPHTIVLSGHDQFHANLRRGIGRGFALVGDLAAAKLNLPIYAHCQAMDAEGLQHDVVKELYAKYKTAIRAGYKPRVEASAPEGWEDAVVQMKSHPEIDNPYALANWMNDQGYTPGGKKGK